MLSTSVTAGRCCTSAEPLASYAPTELRIAVITKGTREMRQYIDKDALVAEIKRRRKLVSDPILSGNDLMIGERNALFNLLSFIDTLEVKEIDGEPRTSAENNDQIAYGYIAENDENK